MRVLLLAFEALWLNVVVPGHRRGAVPLPGERCAACSAHATCPSSGGPDRPAPPGDPAAHCAICYFAARLSPPPVVDFTPPKPQLLCAAPVPAPRPRPQVPFLPTYDGRGPPITASILA